MSSPLVQTIIGRAVTDAEFRKLLSGDLEAVFTQYAELTDADKTELKNMEMATVDKDAGDLDERISKGSMSAFGG